MSAAAVARYAGLAALLLIAGALGFQYIGHYKPCELCMWQRYPHIAAAIVGIGGSFLVAQQLLPDHWGRPLALLTLGLVATSGAIGVYHAGVEWQFWPGPSSCTGSSFHYAGGPLDLNEPVVMCDRAAWRLFHISMAGYNAIISFAIVAAGLYLMAKARRTT